MPTILILEIIVLYMFFVSSKIIEKAVRESLTEFQ